MDFEVEPLRGMGGGWSKGAERCVADGGLRSAVFRKDRPLRRALGGDEDGERLLLL